MKVENIKFKAKSILDGAWVQGDLIHKEDGKIAILRNGFNVSEVDPSTVCQYTGLADCEGNEVWEGDILQDVDFGHFKYVIIFAEGTYLAQREGQYVGIPLNECVDDFVGNVTYAKVVGNKFDK